MHKEEKQVIGRNIVHYTQIDSTQKEIWRRIETNQIENGTVITADIQTNGLGTHGRKWYNETKGNIAFSLVIFPEVPIKTFEHLTIEIAEIILEVFEEIYHIKLEIKQPNDIMIKDKKIGGILTQTKLQGELVKVLVIGIGINTNKQYFEKEIEEIATSIRKEFSIKIDNKLIIQEFCRQFEKKIFEKLKNK